MIRRRLALSLALVPVLPLAACATGRAARPFAPASEADVRETRQALEEADRRAATLPASRLLYDAKMSGGAGPAVPGTLAVTYDGRDVARASLTGPFGSRVAQYDAGAVTGEDQKALLLDVEPGTLRAVLAGAWPGEPSAVEGCDGAECRAVWNGGLRVSAIVDRRSARLSELVLEGRGARLVVTYAGETLPWPERIAAREEKSGRGLRLSLVARESVDASAEARP